MKPSILLRFFGPGVVMMSLCGLAVAADPFQEWTALATAAMRSPASAQPGDYDKSWTAPDGRSVHLVVKVPHPVSDAPVVTIPATALHGDATPAFSAAVADARRLHAGRMLIPSGTYTFDSLPAGGQAHWMLEGLSDVTVEGDGAVLRFMQNKPGLQITHSQRIAIKGVSIEYGFRTASLGSIRDENGDRVLVVDDVGALTAADAVFYVSEYDETARAWVPGGERAILPPGSATPAIYAGSRKYTSAGFRRLTAGKRFIVFHHWYGGAAILIQDAPGPGQSEDVVIDHVHISSGPGMGIVAYGLKRGLAVVDSNISPAPGAFAPVSTEFDAIHVLLGGGDIFLARNLLSSQGDDGINLNNPVTPIVSMTEGGARLVLAKYSRFISAGDRLGFFDSSGNYLGMAQVDGAPRALGGLNNEIKLNHAVAGLDAKSVIRDLELITSRYLVEGNTVERCNCHGILAQLPVGLIQNNVIRQVNHGGIRLLTDVGPWKEGVGAFDVTVKDNQLSGIGIDAAPKLPWAAISVFGTAQGGLVAERPVNSSIRITGNTVDDAQQGCITIASSVGVLVEKNLCGRTNLKQPGSASIQALHARDVTLSANHRRGASTGGVLSDGSAVQQVDY